MDQRRHVREELAERRVWNVDDAVRQIRRDLLRVAREQNSASMNASTRFDGGAEEMLALPHRRAGGENDGRLAIAQELRELPRHVVQAGLVEQRKAGER